MYIKNKKSLAFHAVALIFAAVSILSLMGVFFKEGSYTGLNVMANKNSINSKADWGVHIFLWLGLLLAIMMIVATVLSYKNFIKNNKLLPFGMVAVGVLMVLMAILVYTSSSPIRAYGKNLGAGYIILVMSTVYSLIGAIGTIFFPNKK